MEKKFLNHNNFGTLYLVPTPIGNLEDLSFRAVRVLNEVSLILAENTRTSGKLLKHYRIDTPLRAHHQHNEHREIDRVIKVLHQGKTVAMISDAGTPGISDPGFLLVRACIASHVPVVSLPGATAFVPAIVQSGLPCDRFIFEGFLPHKKGRKTRLEQLEKESRTMVFYESPHRLVKTLSQFCETFGQDRLASVSRELTKLFEETRRGTLSQLTLHFSENSPKGEIVIVVSGFS